MNKTKILIGAAVAGLLQARAHAFDIPKEKLECQDDLVACYGVNKCGGHGSCSSGTHGCGGQNSCKGTGWVAMPKDSCEAVGGSLKPVEGSRKG